MLAEAIVITTVEGKTEDWNRIPDIPDQYVDALNAISANQDNPFGRGLNGIKRCLASLEKITGHQYSIAWTRYDRKLGIESFTLQITTT